VPDAGAIAGATVPAAGRTEPLPNG